MNEANDRVTFGRVAHALIDLRTHLTISGVTRMPPVRCHPDIVSIVLANGCMDYIGEPYLVGFHLLADKALPPGRIELGAWWAKPH